MAKRLIYLVPGFFGFTSLGALNYFHRVGETLQEKLADRGLSAEVIETPTRPTGSIRHRAVRLVETIRATGGSDAEEIHLVGHSTGALDVRLLATQGVRLVPGDVESEIGSRIRSVISVSGPHFGTPLASFFTTLQGRHLLQLLTLLATTGPGRYAIFSASELLQLVARIDDAVGRTDTFLDHLSARLLKRINVAQDDPIWDFLRDVSSDQGAIIQLTPESMNLFNATVLDRPNVYYGSVVTAAPGPHRPRLRDLSHPTYVAMSAIFKLLHSLAARPHEHYPYPSLAEVYRDDVQASLPFKLTSATNDGIVPSLSQIYGELLLTVEADHLDVVGQFKNAGGDPLSDWLPSGAGYNERRFQKTWASIADALVNAAG